MFYILILCLRIFGNIIYVREWLLIKVILWEEGKKLYFLCKFIGYKVEFFLGMEKE